MSAELRRVIKRRKPKFHTKECNKRTKLKGRYRHVEGYNNKQRIGKRGLVKIAKVGYRSPKSVRGFHASGLKEICVNSLKDLNSVDNNVVLRIAGSVGKKLRKQIVEIAVKKKIRIVNFDVKKFTESLEKDLIDRKERRKELLNQRELKHKHKEEKKTEKKEKNIKDLEVMEGSKKRAPRTAPKKTATSMEHNLKSV